MWHKLISPEISCFFSSHFYCPLSDNSLNAKQKGGITGGIWQTDMKREREGTCNLYGLVYLIHK